MHGPFTELFALVSCHSVIILSLPGRTRRFPCWLPGEPVHGCRLQARFTELGIHQATAQNVSGMCMGLTRLQRNPGPAMVQALQQRALDVAHKFSLEDVRRYVQSFAPVRIVVTALQS